MSILLVLYRDSHLAGGSFRVAQNLIKGLSNLDIELTVMFTYGEPGEIHNERLCNTVYLEVKKSSYFHQWYRYRRFIKKYKPDIVHFIQCPLWALLFNKGNIKYLGHIHGGFFRTPLPFISKLIWKWMDFRLNRFVSITNGAKRAVIRKKLISKEKIFVVYNCVDCELLKLGFDKESSRKRLGLPLNADIIGSVGRVVNGRGYDDLIRFTKILGPSWHVLIVGNGPYMDELKEFANKHFDRNRVHFTGALSDVRYAYSAMDAYGFFARYDSFGLATAEAMASSIPIFGLKGAGEYMEIDNPLLTEDNCVLIERPNPEDQWREEIASTFESLKIKVLNKYKSGGIKKMTNIAKEDVNKKFDIPIHTSKMMDVYKTLINNSQ